MSRRYLIIVSVAAHAAFGIGLFITGIWKLERLDYRHRVSLTLGAMMPAGEGGGGEGEQPEKKKEEKKRDKKKDQKTKVQLRQVEKLETDKPDEAELDTGGGGGEGEGEGPDVGPATGGGGGGTCDPLADPNQCQGTPPIVHTVKCGDGIEEAPEQCDDGNLVNGDKCSATCKIEQIIVPPSIFAGLRISGETQIVPPDPVKTQMLREGNERTVGSFKMCLDTSGRISSIAPTGRGTGYSGYDSKIVTTMRTWRYEPYRVNKTPMPVCSVVTFVYTIK